MIREATRWLAEGRTINSVAIAARDVDGTLVVDEAAQLRLKHHGLEDARLWIAELPNADGVGVGFALVHGGALELVVHPAHRRNGLARALASVAAPHADRAWSHSNHPGARALAAEYGWAAVRELWVMRRPLGQATLDPLPTDVTIRSFRPGDEATILEINAAAFAHHPEQGRMDAEDLATRMAEPWFDPEGLLIAEVDGQPAGFHWTKQHDASHGEVYVIGVAPVGQGRGLGRALTQAGLEHLARRGCREVLLYVESDNPAGLNLYTGLGFTHAARDTHVQYRSRYAR